MVHSFAAQAWLRYSGERRALNSAGPGNVFQPLPLQATKRKPAAKIVNLRFRDGLDVNVGWLGRTIACLAFARSQLAGSSRFSVAYIDT